MVALKTRKMRGQAFIVFTVRAPSPTPPARDDPWWYTLVVGGWVFISVQLAPRE